MLLGLPFFYELFVWAPNFKPHQLPPSPCVQIMWTRAIIVPVSFTISTCRFGLTLIAAISRMLIMTLGFRACLFLLTTSSIRRPSGFLTFYLFSDLGLCFLLTLHWVLGFLVERFCLFCLFTRWVRIVLPPCAFTPVLLLILPLTKLGRFPVAWSSLIPRMHLRRLSLLWAKAKGR